MAYEGIPPLRLESWSRSRVVPEFRWAWDDIYAAIPGWVGAGGPYDLVNNLVGTLVGAVNYKVGYQGPEMDFAASTYVSFGDATQFGTAGLDGSFTMSVIHTPVSTAQAGMWIYAASSSEWAPFCLIYSFGANSQYTFWNDNNTHGPSSTTTYAVGTRNFVIARRKGARTASPTLDLFVNGILKGTTTSTFSETYSGSTAGGLLCINRFGGFNGYMGASSMSNIMVWDRALSDAEIECLNDDPYGPLRQMRQEYVFMFKAPVADNPSVKRIGGVPFMTTTSTGVW